MCFRDKIKTKLLWRANRPFQNVSTNIKCDKNNAAKHTACLLRGCYVGGEGAIGGKSEDGK